VTDILDSNSDTRNFDLSQFGAWLLVDGMRERLAYVDDICWVETLETELNRLEQWCAEHSPWYQPGDFNDLWVEISLVRDHIEQLDSDWYAAQRRKEFTVISGGKS
jgi:hypothetical protein